MGNACFGGNSYGNRATLIPTMIELKDKMAGNIQSKNEPVLPTLLERTVTDEIERINFEDHVSGTEGEFYLSLFKPLIFFEVAVFESPKAAQTLSRLYSQLYIAPNTQELVQGPLAQQFDDFMENDHVTSSSFTKLKEEVDRFITLKFLMGYKRHYLRHSKKEIRNASEANQQIDMSRTSQHVFSGSIHGGRSQMGGSASVISMLSGESNYRERESPHVQPTRTINPMAGRFGD